ncbi:LysR family transcriptional regulator [Actinotalea sp. K2]|uniref:LysR family transcriptional regulator n=1 Tax=Actinotalea sp. K2 TaxID=2939438 RepID=UPI00201829F6|nr:LysR family transcriptional regulator [Actinotalea sp. K2]MCL3861493.1 LysR family transcriptional regulator [Actinotalea sp. K2]
MDLRRLEVLRAVAERGGVAAAARALHCTPSAVSQQLKVLQREAGAALTERDGRGIRLTPAGAELARRAVDVAVALRRAEAACAEHQSLPTGTVTVAAFQSAAQMLLPGLLTRLRSEPGITVVLSDDDVAQDQFAGLTSDADIVIAHRPDRTVAWGEAVRCVPLLREPLDVAVPPGHRLAGRAGIEPRDLRGERWIAVREGFPVAAVLAAVGRSAGEVPVVAHRINDFHVAEALVAAGHGISLLPRFTADDRDGQRFGMVPLEGVRAGREIDALLRPDRAERVVVRRVLDALVAEANDLVG